MIKFLFKTFLALFMLAGFVGVCVAAYFFIEISKDLPKIEKIEDYAPDAVSSVYSADGTLIGELFSERRYPVSISEIPLVVRQAFLAAEDANFYSHPGIDIRGIIRAVVANLREKRSAQGASTITQQVVKSLLLTREKTYTRKVKEAILAYRLENKLSKDDIFSIYLNEIFLGKNSYGIVSAARAHFGKELKDITLHEAAFLAGLPQKPSVYSNPKYFKEAKQRQAYVLRQMFENNMITDSERSTALRSDLDFTNKERPVIFAAPYYTNYIFKRLEQLGINAKSPGGLTIKTALDLEAYSLAEKALREGLEEYDRRRGFRGPIDKVDLATTEFQLSAEPEPIGDKRVEAIVTKLGFRGGEISVLVSGRSGVLNNKLSRWANKKLVEVKDPTKSDYVVTAPFGERLRVGDVIEVRAVYDEDGILQKNKDGKPYFKIDQTPEIQGALVLINPDTGELKTLVGGYDYQQSVFNRATQALRQPGSSFKAFVYLAALQALDYSASTIVPDVPVSLMGGDGKLWEPQNYDKKFRGPMTLRSALQASRNVVSVFLIQMTGVDRVVQLARQMGIESRIPAELSISLGSAEVKPLELTRAYGVFAADGKLQETIDIIKVEDREGGEVFRAVPESEQVVSPEHAFVMANIMKGVVERGTAQRVRALKRPVAGKTGTTNNQMDAWFIGYTPNWVLGVWTGFDQKQNLGKGETGGRVASPIFIRFMDKFLAGKPVQDFAPPKKVTTLLVNLDSGVTTTGSDPRAFWEYFVEGTEPVAVPIFTPVSEDSRQNVTDYLLNEDF